jgi:NADPH:quinone reductase-like Zn-dependent oxidoreductase
VPFLSGGPEDQTAEVLRTLLEAAAQGRITPPATRGMALDQAAQAHEQVEKGGAGKIVLIP